jgi:Putative Ig domain/PA14 domain
MGNVTKTSVYGKLKRALACLGALAAVATAQPGNMLLVERWNGLSGATVSSLTGNANYPNSPASRYYLTNFEFTTLNADGYGTRVRGYITPPTTGSYTFWIASDDASELLLGTSSDPATATVIASVGTWTNPREWTKFTTQQSTARTLTAGVSYYIETRQVDGTGGDGLAVGWQGPGITGEAERPIPASRLSAFAISGSPTITTQPANRTVTVGATAAFSVVAAGNATLTYQWRKNGANISGATSANYTTPATVAGDNNAVFSCLVSNSLGARISNNATLTIGTAPNITTPATSPLAVTATVGTAYSYTVVATGTAPITYSATSLPPGLSINSTSGAITGTPTTAGSYSTTVTAANGLTPNASKVLNFTVGAGSTAPNITTPATTPFAVTATVGTAYSYTVVATGTAPITYSATSLPPGLAINSTSGAITGTPTTAGSYSTTVTAANGVSPNASKVLSFTVNPAPVAPNITTPATSPFAVTATVGTAYNYTVVATGTAPITYSATSLPPGLSINSTSGAITGTPTTAGSYSTTVTAANGVNPNASKTLSFTVNPASSVPVIITQPVSQTVAAGAPVTFTVAATGTAPLTYQWWRTPAGSTTPVSISGATSVSYTIAATTLANNGEKYSVVVSNASGNTPSAEATLTVTAPGTPPVIVMDVADRFAIIGGSARFEVVADGNPLPTYQWRKTVGATTTDIPGATANFYLTPALTSGDNNNKYSVVINNSYGQVTSRLANLTVGPATVISVHPASVSVNSGATATFSVTATGIPTLGYQWFKNGDLIQGASGASYTTPATTPGDDKSAFYVVVTSPASSATSNSAVLSINATPTGPSIVSQPTSQTVAIGATAIFTVTANGTAPLTYQWYKNGTAIFGATASSYATPPTTVSDNGATFRVHVSNAVASNVQSATVTLTVSASINLVSVNGPAASNREFTWQTSGSNRWALTAENTPESGSNAGSNLLLRAFSDAGALIDNVVSVTRAAGGTMTMNRPVAMTGGPLALNGNAEGILLNRNVGSGYVIWQDGANNPRWTMQRDHVDGQLRLQANSQSTSNNGLFSVTNSINATPTLSVNTSLGYVGIGIVPVTHKFELNGGQARFLDQTNANYTGIMIRGQNGVGSSQKLAFVNDGNGLVAELGGQVVTANTSVPTHGRFFINVNNNGNAIRAMTIEPTGATTFGGPVTVPSIRTAQWNIEPPDYVFEPKYKLKKLDSLEAFIKTHKHLPEIPSAKQIKSEGLDLSEMNLRLLKKVEELTLYILEQNKQNRNQQAEIDALKKAVGK